MMYLMVFAGAVAVVILVFELMNALTESALGGGGDRLSYGPTCNEANVRAARKCTSLDALLIAVWPERFDPDHAASISDVVDMLRRAGYPCGCRSIRCLIALSRA